MKRGVIRKNNILGMYDVLVNNCAMTCEEATKSYSLFMGLRSACLSVYVSLKRRDVFNLSQRSSRLILWFHKVATGLFTTSGMKNSRVTTINLCGVKCQNHTVNQNNVHVIEHICSSCPHGSSEDAIFSLPFSQLNAGKLNF